MTNILTAEQLQALKAIDTPTICNAIETFQVRGRVEGFLTMNIRCLLPELGTMVGYAIPMTVDSTTPDIPQDPQVWYQWMKAMESSPKPGVLVMKDTGPQRVRSAHLGEVMGTIACRLGVAGIVTDGGLRDILEVKALGLQCFAAGLVAAHGNPRLVEIGVPVVIDDVLIRPGDLLHGDPNGLTIIPEEIAGKVAGACQKVRDNEAEMMSYIKSLEFTPEGFMKRRYGH